MQWARVKPVSLHPPTRTSRRNSPESLPSTTEPAGEAGRALQVAPMLLWSWYVTVVIGGILCSLPTGQLQQARPSYVAAVDGRASQ